MAAILDLNFLAENLGNGVNLLLRKINKQAIKCLA